MGNEEQTDLELSHNLKFERANGQTNVMIVTRVYLCFTLPLSSWGPRACAGVAPRSPSCLCCSCSPSRVRGREGRRGFEKCLVDVPSPSRPAAPSFRRCIGQGLHTACVSVGPRPPSPPAGMGAHLVHFLPNFMSLPLLSFHEVSFPRGLPPSLFS